MEETWWHSFLHKQLSCFLLSGSSFHLLFPSLILSVPPIPLLAQTQCKTEYRRVKESCRESFVQCDADCDADSSSLCILECEVWKRERAREKTQVGKVMLEMLKRYSFCFCFTLYPLFLCSLFPHLTPFSSFHVAALFNFPPSHLLSFSFTCTFQRAKDDGLLRCDAQLDECHTLTRGGSASDVDCLV